MSIKTSSDKIKGENQSSNLYFSRSIQCLFLEEGKNLDLFINNRDQKYQKMIYFTLAIFVA